MKNEYMFQFGYGIPALWTAYEEHGWDDEQSSAVFITAESKEAAIQWGCEIAEAFMKHLFTEAGWKGEIPSWKESQFAHCVNEVPYQEYSKEALNRVVKVNFGEYPDLTLL